MSDNEKIVIRKLVADAMSGHHAHADFDAAVEDFPAALHGVKPAGAPHSAWQLLEHMRIAQWDILEFSRNPAHKSPKWPDQYWPVTEAPPDSHAWQKSVEAFQKDARALHDLVLSPDQNLFKRFSHGEGQNLMREALLVANHNSYHLGQLVFLKKLLQQRA
jgi:DinB superfamily